jgi:probable HAF family extracellular repeat protein
MKTFSNLHGLIRILIVLFVCAAGASFAQAQDYRVTNLGPPGSWAPTKGLNASGQVAYTAYINECYLDSRGQYQGCYRAYFFDGAASRDIGSLGGHDTQPVAVNASGQVVGYSSTAGGTTHAFSWTQVGGMVDLGTLGGVSGSVGRGINDLGQVVGDASTASGEWHAFLWTQAGGMVDLGTLGGQWASVTGINNSGQVVGQSYIAGNGLSGTHPFSWTSAGGMRDLGTLGGVSGYPNDVNASGQVAGRTLLAGNTDFHAFSWTQAGGMVDLGALGGRFSEAMSVNASGQVVGYS